MNLGFLVNRIEQEEAGYATTSMARAAVSEGHRVWYIGVEDFAFDPDDRLRARAVTAPDRRFRSNESFLKAIQAADAAIDRLAVSDLDVLMLRNNPAEDADRSWAQSVGVIFGQLAVQQGVLVLNDPHHLANALNKLYFQTFPVEIRPRTLITRSREEVQQFVQSERGNVVLKPLQGSGGQGVFLVREKDPANLNQIFDAISRDGYVVAQEYISEAAEGDLRLFLMNGKPLCVNGKYAAFRRIGAAGDIRSNMHVGGRVERAKIDEKILRIAEVVRPKLVRDGMFLVGLDIAGDKLMEINVFSPGGLYSMNKLEGEDFAVEVVRALERKVNHQGRYQEPLGNVQLATL